MPYFFHPLVFRLIFEPQAILPAVIVTLDPRQRARRKQIQVKMLSTKTLHPPQEILHRLLLAFRRALKLALTLTTLTQSHIRALDRHFSFLEELN